MEAFGAFYEIFDKEDNLSRYAQIFENVLQGICLRLILFPEFLEFSLE